MLKNQKLKLLGVFFSLFVLLTTQTQAQPVHAIHLTSGATRDIVLIIDTSASMAFETGNESNCDSNNPSLNTCLRGDADDDPSVCNINDTCQPMRAVKDAALEFIDLINFPSDRVGIVVMTSQSSGGNRYPITILPLTSTKQDVVTAINSIKVFEPRDCDGTDTLGPCSVYYAGTYNGLICQIYELYATEATADPSSCPTSNIGGTLRLASELFVQDANSDASWVVVGFYGGPANTTDVVDPINFPNGFCPMNTWLVAYGQSPWCRDKYPSTRHSYSDTASYTNPASGVTQTISIYDADDYARDMADQLAALTSNSGDISIYTIGMGYQIQLPARDSSGNIIVGEPPPAEDLLEYIATESGSNGQYFYAPDTNSLEAIFQTIADNISCEAVVTNTNDSGDGSLREAIADACHDATITFDSSLSGQTIHLQSTLTIDKNITIDASSLSEKVILSGDSDNDTDGDILILNILTNRVVTIRNAEFTKGYSPASLSAGAIENLGDLSVYDSEFHFNSGEQGGAIRNSGDLYVADSTFTNNTALEGGAILNNLNAEAEIRNSIFSNNSANEVNNLGGGGGAIANVGTLDIFDSEFINNSSNGGGAVLNSREGTTNIYNSVFTGNSASEYGGGAVNNFEGVMTINQSTFSNNSGYSGGAISAGKVGEEYITTTTISESIITNNEATFLGGGIDFASGVSMTIDKTIISENTAQAGGGINNITYGAPLIITNSLIANNTSTEPQAPGGIFSFLSPLTVENSTITGNSKSGIGQQGITVINNSTIAGNEEGGLDIYNYSLSLTNSILANNGNFDCRTQNSVTITTNQNNIIETNSGCGTPASTADPLLGPLADNGGLTQTMALLSGSPAINAGDNATCESTDQRGVSRPQGLTCDIGAYEYNKAVTLPAPRVPRTMFRLLTSDSTPTLSWQQVNKAFGYKITIASDKSFTTIILSENTFSSSFTPIDSLPDGVYYWRVQALDEILHPGKVSAIQTLTIDTTVPNIPTLTSPADGAELRRSPILRWTRVSGGVLYILEVANNENFEDATRYTLRTNSRNLSALPNGDYYWRVKAIDAVGNESGWSEVREFEIDR